MARLPSVNKNRGILQADLRGVPADVAANPYMQIAGALGDIGQRVHNSELDTAQQEGSNAVYRDADGNLQVTLKDNTTDTARAYNHAAQLGMMARLQGDIRTQGQQQADAAKGDPAVFNAGWNTYQKGILKNAPEELRGPIQAQLDQYGSQFSLGVSEVKRKRDIAVFEADTKAEGQNLMDEMATLARGGGTNTPDYQAKRGQLVSLYQNMVANPDFTMSQKQADIDLKHAESRNMAEALVGSVNKTLQTDGIVAARKQSEGILTDTSLNLSPAERRQYNGIMDETINGFVAQQKVAVKPFQDQSTQVQKLLDQQVGIDNPAIDDLIGNLARGGDPNGALALMGARNTARVIRDFKLATPEQRLQIAQSGIAVANGVPSATESAAGGSPQTGKLFNAIEQRNGLPAGYLARTMQIESGGRNTGPNQAGAEGYFQFIPSTAARMGVNPRDLNSSADGAGRLAAESARYLRTGLGREPTAAELYLAHQQGAAGAMKLLSNPNENAASLVGTKAIIQNGGREDMTAAQFAQMWANKFDGTKGTTTAIPSGNGLGVPPDAIKAYREGVTADAKAYWSDIQDGIKKGYAPDANEFSLFARQLALVDDPNFKSEVGRFMNSEAAGQALAQLPPEQRAAAISGLQASAADGSTLAQQDILSAAQRYDQQSAEAIKNDPIGYAAQRGFAKAVPPIDVAAGTDAVSAALAARQNTVNLLRARGEVGNISALRPVDKTALSSFIETATPAAQAAMLGAMSNSLSPETFKSTMADLASKPDTRALATAGAIYAENPEVAQSIIRGRTLLTANPNFAPKKSDSNTADVDQILPPTAFGAGLEGARQQILEAATARYADLSSMAGDTSAELNSTRMTQAVNDVTGGALTMNGETVIAPRYGMTQDQFDGLMRGIKPEQITGAITADGTQISPRDIWRQGRLKAVGDGQYLIDFSLPGSTPAFAQTAPVQGDSRLSRVSGGPFILDLREK
ncbi:hypothetical protein [Rhizobium rhizogenes]|uniref:hypothetical protein n=1 Tax=Rhizobium rhizogenes TaxID=359 RepID=UPI0015743904|nr:hypothetical protein [Rhizobium rhizogenes]NTG94256.1 lytic transglycosylase domain-containing protein [Rhizobium rhizogenes]